MSNIHQVKKDFTDNFNPFFLSKEDLVATYLKINQLVAAETKIRPDAASTVRGNIPVAICPGKMIKGVTLHDVVITELHGTLRDTVGNMAKKLDKTSLPDDVQLIHKNMTGIFRDYRKQTRISFDMLSEYYDKNSDEKREQSNYKEVWRKIIDLFPKGTSEFEILKEADAQIQSLEWQTNLAIEALDKALAETESFRLKNNSEELINAGENQVRTLMYAEWLVISDANTVKMPDIVSRKIDGIMGTTKYIFPGIISNFENCPGLLTALTPVLARGIEKLQNTLTVCGSFEALQQECGDALNIAGITSQEKYDVIKTRVASEKDASLAKNEITEPQRAQPAQSGGCPFGHKSPGLEYRF